MTFIFADDFMMVNMYLVASQLCVSLQTDCIKRIGRGWNFCFCTTMLHTTSFVTYDVPWTSDFLIGELEEEGQVVVPGKSISLTTDFFCWVL